MLHPIVDAGDEAQQRVWNNASRRIEECGAEFVGETAPDPDALLVFVTHGNSAREIVAAAERAACPAIIWAARERWAWPSGALAIGKLEQDGRAATLVYGQPDEEEVIASLGIALRTAGALGALRRSRIGTVGDVFPNLVSCAYDKEGIRTSLGTEIVDLPIATVRQQLNIVAEEEVSGCIEKTRALYRVEADLHGRCRGGVALHLALTQLAHRHDLDALAVECWTGRPYVAALRRRAISGARRTGERHPGIGSGGRAGLSHASLPAALAERPCHSAARLWQRLRAGAHGARRADRRREPARIAGQGPVA
jgi:L-fucose isomerase-like protein